MKCICECHAPTWSRYINRKVVRFIVHPQEGWLGSSPDGIAMDSSSNTCKSLLEVKCPYAKRDMSPEEGCKDPNFYCYISDKGVFTLKSLIGITTKFSCSFMYQQIFVNGVTFVSLQPIRGILIEQIYMDSEWVGSGIAQLTNYSIEAA